ncbi:hypothetical protein D3C75_570210 [compost metagenome]
MSANITSEGFKQIREFIQNKWKYIQVLGENNEVLFTVEPNDTRIGTQFDAYLNNPLIMELYLQGTDPEISIGTAIGGANLVAEIDGEAMVSVVYTNKFVFQNPEDQLAIRIQLQIPTI